MNLYTDCIDTDCISKDCINTNCINTNCIYTDSVNADCITKDCINAKFNHANCIKNRSHNTNLYCLNSYDMNLDRVTDSHVELNVLNDMQELLSNGLHKISFDYDEDTAKTKILK
jgi:hypothetical protein